MLWCNQKNVHNFDEIIHHKEIIKRLQNVQYLQNMFFYGPEGSGKLTIIKLFLKQLLQIKNDTLQQLNIPITTTKQLTIYQNKYYYYIDLLTIVDKKVEFYLFDKFITNIIKSKNILTKKHIFFINNITKKNKIVIQYIKQFISKYTHNSIFILCSNKHIFYNNKLNSFFIQIRIPQIKKDTIQLILKDILIQTKTKTKINKQTYSKIIDNSQNNLSTAITLLQLKLNNTYEFKQFIKRNDKYFDKILKLIMKKQSIQNVEVIRLFIYDTFIKYNNENLIVKFTKYLLQLPEKKISDKYKHQIINIAANIECQINKVTKDLICFELFLIQLNLMFNS